MKNKILKAKEITKKLLNSENVEDYLLAKRIILTTGHLTLYLGMFVGLVWMFLKAK